MELFVFLNNGNPSSIIYIGGCGDITRTEIKLVVKKKENSNISVALWNIPEEISRKR